MLGDKVVVRAYGNNALIRTVWDANDRLVYIVNHNEYGDMVSGNIDPNPVGFPIEDVFIYNNKYDLDKIDWSELKN